MWVPSRAQTSPGHGHLHSCWPCHAGVSSPLRWPELHSPELPWASASGSPMMCSAHLKAHSSHRLPHLGPAALHHSWRSQTGGGRSQVLIGQQLFPTVSKPLALSAKTSSWDSWHASLKARGALGLGKRVAVSWVTMCLQAEMGCLSFYSHVAQVRRNPCACNHSWNPGSSVGCPDGLQAAQKRNRNRMILNKAPTLPHGLQRSDIIRPSYVTSRETVTVHY